MIGHPSNKADYRANHPYCEVCGNLYAVAIHHHLPQKRLLIEHHSNYTTLCHNYMANGCNAHAMVESSKKQFEREISPHSQSKFYGWEPIDIWDYLHDLKEGWTIERIEQDE
jgi:hypothetical protein